ncbi:MAG: 23S rRNA (guanosine(2251)-2'-O)-methyltransferase RlmB [Gammaproteobacteria bacterium]|nr:23S rRNA (guanosine(2251)-2'-O)-methyltransferase RlmB [Gammaproteobacteria bacterium]
MELIYGIHAVDSLLRQNPQQVQCLWLQSGREDQRVAGLIALARNRGVRIERESRQQLDARVSGRHQGVVAEIVGGAPQWDEAALFSLLERLQNPALLLVLDGVTDPHNLGACLRSADAAGVHAVIVPKDKSADLTATVRKVACGAAEVIPFVRVTNLVRTLEGLKERGIWLYGAAGESENFIYNSDLTGSLAIVMGAEGTGLRRLTRETCDHLVKLPMAGSVSSLNVSVATGVCLFEVVRQRQT